MTDDPRVLAEMATNELRKSVIDVAANASMIFDDPEMRNDIQDCIAALIVTFSRANKDAA